MSCQVVGVYCDRECIFKEDAGRRRTINCDGVPSDGLEAEGVVLLCVRIESGSVGMRYGFFMTRTEKYVPISTGCRSQSLTSDCVKSAILSRVTSLES